MSGATSGLLPDTPSPSVAANPQLGVSQDVGPVARAFGTVLVTYSVLSHRGAAMIDKTRLNLAAERGIALATWGL